MSKTTWRAAPYRAKTQWLCDDGTILNSPPVETTPSQRRWRITGSTDSVAKHELDAVIVKHLQAEANRKGTVIWMQVGEEERHEITGHARVAGHRNPGSFYMDVPPSMDLGSANTMLPVAYEFTHTTLPLKVMVWVILTVRNGSITVTSRLTYRPLSWSAKDIGEFTKRLWDDKGSWYGADHDYDTKPTGITIPLGVENFPSNLRAAATYFLNLLRQAEDMDTVTLPEIRAGRSGVHEFRFSRTNYSKDLQRNVLDIVQSGPSMERLAEHLAGVKRELSTLGIVINSKENFDLNALLSGKLSEMRVRISPQGDNPANDGLDPMHTVHFDLAQGIFVVSCAHHDLDDVAEAWGVSLFKAEITGEKDKLLAYAEAYHETTNRQRLRRILSQRKVPDSTPDT